MANPIDMTGKRYAKVVGVRITGLCASRDKKWLFRCDCGGEFEANGYAVRSGKVKSCPACAAARSRMASVVHGKTNTKEFGVWTDIKTRCYNARAAAYDNYGGRGIKVCDRWLNSFEDFLADMGQRPSDKHSIERNDVNGDYTPENCRWATDEEQALNKTTTVWIEVDGVRKPLATWAKEKGVSIHAVRQRYAAGIQGPELFAPSLREGCIEFNGIKDTFAGWAKRTGIKPSTIAMRVTKYGWPVSKALTQGVSL